MKKDVVKVRLLDYLPKDPRFDRLREIFTANENARNGAPVEPEQLDLFGDK